LDFLKFGYLTVVCFGLRASDFGFELVALPLARADASNRFDLNKNLCGRKTPDFNQGRAWKIPAEKFLPGAPHFDVVLDVHNINGEFHNVRHGAARGLNEVPDLTEDHLCLFVFISALDSLAVAGARNHARNEQHVTDAQRVRPSTRWRFSDMWARYSFNVHTILSWAVPRVFDHVPRRQSSQLVFNQLPAFMMQSENPWTNKGRTVGKIPPLGYISERRQASTRISANETS
jgi:hypothetical protein